jgi:2-polyprenyl-6-methoxyphenol hydroxylase-like FAD-dependent oxidoreductase
VKHHAENRCLPDEVDVLIVGGGPTGLVMSALLSQLRVSNLVVERKPALPGDPAAHVIRKRSVAILSLLASPREVQAIKPDLALDYITWCTTLAGREIGKLDLRIDPATGEYSPTYPWTNIPQNLLHPMLFASASKYPHATIALGVKCVGVESRADFAIARATTSEDGPEHGIKARWVVAADGAGSPTRSTVGIRMEGPGPLATFFMVHFKADLRPLMEGRSGPLYWIYNPEAPGVFIVHEPDQSSVFMTPVTGSENEADRLPERLKKALGATLPFEILAVRTWAAHSQVAAHYREGRVLLVGDAAHRFPPTGGLGLNTGILEAHNLAWKLALVLNGKAGEGLLDTYEVECRPAARANADGSLQNQFRLGLIMNVLGGSPDLKSLEARIDNLTEDEKTRLAGTIEAQRSHFTFDGNMPGSFRASSANRLGPVVSPYGIFRLAARDVEPWKGIAARLSSETGIDVRFSSLASEYGGDIDEWLDRQHAVLARPDGIVEWSAETTGDAAYTELRHVLDEILMRGQGTKGALD